MLAILLYSEDVGDGSCRISGGGRLEDTGTPVEVHLHGLEWCGAVTAVACGMTGRVLLGWGWLAGMLLVLGIGYGARG